MKSGVKRVVLTLVALAVVGAAAGGVVLISPEAGSAPRVEVSEVDLSALKAVKPEQWAALRTKRIFFGHQSVGENVIAGLAEIQKRMPEIGLRVVESSDPSAFDEPGFVHAKVGANRDPESKMRCFSNVVKGPAGERIDLALLKLCYVDVEGDNNYETVLDEYKTMAAELHAARPNVRLLHATIPLTIVELGPKSKVKRLIGRNVRGYAENVIRNKYNEQLKAEFGKDGAGVFDVARSEAVLPNGHVSTFRWEGAEWECMSTGYARDRGHPNEAGEVAAARDLLLLLVNQSE